MVTPIATLLLVLLLGGRGEGHYDPMINLDYPEPPPTADPGSRATLLRVTIRDAANGHLKPSTSMTETTNPTSSTAFRTRPTGTRSRFRSGGFLTTSTRTGDSKFACHRAGRRSSSERATNTSPRPGCRGEPSQHARHRRSHQTGDRTAADGWYSGDTHIHMDRTGGNDDSLLAVTSAKDIRYTFLLSMNTDGYNHGGEKYES